MSKGKKRVMLFEARTTDGNGQPVDLDYPGDGAGHYIIVSGNLGGGNVGIRIQASTGEWVPFINGTLSEVGCIFLESTHSQKRIRATLTGSAGANVTVEVVS